MRRWLSLSVLIGAVALVIGVALLSVGGAAAAAGRLAIGVVLLLVGGEMLVDGSVAIARRLGVSPLVIGLTLVAFGTSAPELAFNVVAAAKGSTDLSFGNVVGSNIANIGLVLGICAAVFSPVNIHSQVIRRELPFLLAVSTLMLVLAFGGWPAASGDSGPPGFARPEGAIMLAVFAGFLYLWYRVGRQDPQDVIVVEMETDAVAEPGRGLPSGLAGVFCLVGIAGLAGGGQLAEAGAVAIAEWLELSQRYVGLTVVAVATSLPEVFASLGACRKNHDDLAIGNVVGSNMFNILLVLGTTTVVQPVPMPSPGGAMDLAVMMGFTVLLMAFAVVRDKTLGRIQGLVLLVAWASYLTLSGVTAR